MKAIKRSKMFHLRLERATSWEKAWESAVSDLTTMAIPMSL